MLHRQSLVKKIINRRVAKKTKLKIHQFEMTYKDERCILVELKDEKDGWKLVNSSDDVLLWSCEQTMMLVEDGQIKTLHGSIKFIDDNDFQEFKNRREGGVHRLYTKDSPDSPPEEEDFDEIEEGVTAQFGDPFIMRTFSFEKMANTSKSFKILASLVPDKQEVEIKQGEQYLYEITFPNDKRRNQFKKKNQFKCGCLELEH